MLRLLDLGGHDGSIASWLTRQLDTPVQIDVLEANPHAAAIARERLHQVGKVKVGLAQDAPNLFKAHSYDAVVCMEVIEHVPDVGQLLDACETMVKPDGLVFISTPDGTFGTGNNPNHLRVYRSIDLADLLRRRGRLHDMHAGEDGVVVAAYQPSPRLGDVAIYCGPGWQTWGPADIFRRGLGGSETAAVRLAEQLSELGHIVTVYGEVEEGAYRDIIFRSWRTFDPMLPRQAVISSRIPAIFDRRIAAPHRLLWLHDTDVGDELTPARAEQIDHVLVLSDWHRQHVARRYPFLKGKLVQTRNGVHLDWFPAPLVEAVHA